MLQLTGAEHQPRAPARQLHHFVRRRLIRPYFGLGALALSRRALGETMLPRARWPRRTRWRTYPTT